MKKKDLDELKNKSREQLKKTLAELSSDIAKLKLELSQSKLKNLHSVKKKKKEIAQVLTIMNAQIFAERKDKENAK